MPAVALVAPQSWYYATVPADLSWAAGALRAAGHTVEVFDLAARIQHDLLGATPAWNTLRDPEALDDPDHHRQAALALFDHCAPIANRFQVRLSPTTLAFPDADGTHLPTSLRVGLDPQRNPALPTVWRTAQHLIRAAPDLVAITCVHPEQRVGAPVLARLLREAGFDGLVVLYGSLEDVINPLDLTPDLLGRPTHRLFDDLDAVILGEAETALVQIATTGSVHDLPNVLIAGATEPPPRPVEDRGPHPPPPLPGEGPHRNPHPPPRRVEDLDTLPTPSFLGFDPQIYPYPTPVVDLRVGRGCPWSRCAFCAIQAHQPGWRTGGIPRAVEAMRTAHLQLGSQWFRVRDDLLTPTQLGALGQACTDLPFKPRWSARARFSPQLTHDVLQTARDGGLGELWLGLESASERVRDAMHKGVRDDVVERVLSDCHRLGIRVRALCILGFPGERLSEARQTVRFLLDNAHRLASASLTRFQLMRNSPMVADPDRYGLTVQPDPLPRHERLRFQVPASFADALDDDALAPLIAELSEAIPTAFPDHHGPTLTHAWMRSAP